MALTLYLALLVSRAAFSVGGSDSSGYFNTARALDAGSLVERAAAYDSLGLDPNRIHVVLPLGFVPGPRIGTMAPFYPVGLPLHMLVAGRLAGWKTGPFLVSPVAATLSVLLIALLAREFGLRAIGCVWAAVILAVCPVFVFQALQPMSDVVATFWTLLAILAALRACNRPRSLPGAPLRPDPLRVRLDLLRTSVAHRVWSRGRLRRLRPRELSPEVSPLRAMVAGDARTSSCGVGHLSGMSRRAEP